jgi:hypothetical protein
VAASGVHLHAEDALAQAEHVRNRWARRGEKEDGFFACLKLRRANDHIPVAPDLAAGHPERHRVPGASFQVGSGRDGDDRVDAAAIVGVLGTHRSDTAIDDDLRAGDDLAELRWKQHGRAKLARTQHQDEDQNESTHLSLLLSCLATMT